MWSLWVLSAIFTLCLLLSCYILYLAIINHVISRCHCMLASMGHEIHDDVIKWKHFPCYWPFMWGIHWSPVNSPRKGQWRGALMFSLICAWINGWVNNHEAGDLKCHCAHYDFTLMLPAGPLYPVTCSNALWLLANDGVKKSLRTGTGPILC